ncbi:MAG: hypothetical protein ACM3XM_19595 [Mycobacterium leprae]
MKEVGGLVDLAEDVLRTHRDQAIKILNENRAQSREGIELLVQERLGAIAAATHQGKPELTHAEANALYKEILDLSFMMFSLGYTMAHAVAKEPARAR